MRRRTASLLPALLLAAGPMLVALLALFGPLRTDAALLYSGLAVETGGAPLAGSPTIDGNYGITSQALGVRAARDVLAGHLPLWNHEAGLGAPLLGEMQSAALFPPTWLQALPHGQALEQAALQLVAGLGTCLFLRRLGLGRLAATAGGVAFEFNGVFAWLRNAVYNPVALLPWLFLALEMMRDGAEAGGARRRASGIALAAAAAALALTAGFPEEVYLYGLLLVAWALMRMAALPWRAARRFALDLAGAGALAAALAAPALLAFADFLGRAEVGGHGGEGFAVAGSDPGALLQHLVPYVYGTIFGSPDPRVTVIWDGTGGYVGFAGFALALAALAVPRRRAAKLLLAGWAAVALGASYGVPGLLQGFAALPLMHLVVFARYLVASWAFCIVALAALFLDDAATLPRRRLRWTLGGAIALALLAVAGAAAADADVLRELAATSRYARGAFRLGSLSTGLLALGLAASALARPGRAAPALGAVVLAEAMAWFAVPFLSYPRHGRLDLDLLGFLRAEAGTARVVGFEVGSLWPNYGSAFGVATLGYDDLPVPSATSRYIREAVDPFAKELALLPASWGLTPRQADERRQELHARLPAYARAGVALVMGGGDLALVSPFVGMRDAGAAALEPGGALAAAGRAGPHLRLPVSGLAVKLDGAASGRVSARFCAAGACAEGSADLAGPRDGGRLAIPLDRPLALVPGADWSVSLARAGGEGRIDVALLAPAPPEDPDGAAGGGAEPGGAEPVDPETVGPVPDVRLRDDALALVHVARTASVYRIAGARDYLSAPNCRLSVASRDALEASCAAASRLTRLELAMPGWTASVGGAPAPVETVEGVFQAVDLPAGDSAVAFGFAPRGFGAALAAADAALALMLGIAAMPLIRRLRA